MSPSFRTGFRFTTFKQKSSNIQKFDNYTNSKFQKSKIFNDVSKMPIRCVRSIPFSEVEGLVAELRAVDARLPDYDDSSWEIDGDIQERRSVGFTFAWYRLKITVPEQVKGQDVAGKRVWFETNVDNYGEIWIDGEIDRASGVIVGNNVQQRVTVSSSAQPGSKHVIACLAANGPLAEPRGGIFMRYATLSFEEAPPR